MPKVKKEEPKLWKDYVNRESLTKFAVELTKVYSKFDQKGFVKAVCTSEFFELELKDRLDEVARQLKQFLPKSYKKAIDILIKATPNVGGFYNWAMTLYVEQNGLDHFGVSIKALYELTKYGTAEFAIRSFIIRHTDKMLKVLNEWVKDPSEHIRRLAAEGSRPRGVWVVHIEAFKKDPKPVLKLLKQLKADESLYVRKAVANNLNDISKDNPNLVIKTAKRWLKDNNPDTNWIIKHACRSLIKKGDPRVFPLFGYTTNPNIKIAKFNLSNKKVKIGSSIKLDFEIKSLSKNRQRLAVDYKFYFVKKSSNTTPKTFKLSEKTIKGKDVIPFSIKYKFKDLSTRKHYPGKHKIEIIINGKMYKKVSFKLE